MRTFIAVLALLSLVLAAEVENGDNSWDFIDFVTRWTGTACVQTPAKENGNMTTFGAWPGSRAMEAAVNGVPSTVKNFTIHGSWPDRSDGTWPAFCKQSYPFNWNEISDLKAQLDVQWPSFTGPNPDFYTHEWEKHGTCALNVMANEHAYFTQALAFNQRWNLYGALAQGGFPPSFTQAYSINGMTDALSRTVGSKVAIQCSSSSNKLYVMAVHICFNSKLAVQDCPAFVVKDCQAGCHVANALLPPVTSSCYRS